MEGLLLDLEASHSTALPPLGGGALLGRRALKVEGPSGPVSQGTCQCVCVWGVHGAGGGGERGQR